MRNLKKILAMALALIMSLSLMATAGAADFTDASSINDTYKVAVDVLEGLGVFKGYEENGSYRFDPTGSITRAETAAIIYRIVTGDVNDEQVAIYRDYGIFDDVPSNAWYAGYVNFCANAEYIKGVGNREFRPSDKVEGYAALAMILRAIGYTANGGFTGNDWRVQTARVGEARNITKNITATTLRSEATREIVAEILFQAILVNMVDHNVLNTLNGEQGYTEIDGQTLGKKTFGLEEVIGVVVANEYADLNSAQHLAKDRTDLQVGDETWNLNYGTEITDIGEARRVFTTNKTGVVGMYDNVDGVALNTVTEFGHACDISSASKFSAAAEMPAASDIEYYVNFDRVGHYDCDQRLEFVVKFELKDDGNGNSITYYPNSNTRTYSTLDEIVEDFESRYVNGLDLRTGVGMTIVAGSENVGSTTVTYSKIIRAKDEITQDDMNVIRGIFYAADNQNSTTTLYQGVEGDVYVGTRSNNANDTDWSDELSYTAWVDRFINDISYDISWDTSWNGDWVKFVDNDKDGAAEYAFKTHYALEEALYTYTDRDDNTIMEFNTFDDANWGVRYLDGYTPVVGDKVLAAWIDGQYLVEPANSETVTVSEYSWRNDEITTDKGTYGQSGIDNNTDMLELISNMEDKIEYIVYFDHFGYVRAYELPGGTTYALITEMYYTNGNQGNVVKDWPMTAELSTLNDEGETVTEEYSIANGASTFTAVQPWLRVSNAVATYNYNNWLQPAIAHLGVDYKTSAVDYTAHKGTPAFAVADGSYDDYIASGAYATFWDANRQLVRRLNNMTGCEEFNYGAQTITIPETATTNRTWTQPATSTFTNVAIVNIDGNNATLTGAAQLALEKNGAVKAAPYTYARDYIQLSTEDVVADAVRYTIFDDGNGYDADNNYWVNAVHDTQYFIAYNGGVYSFKDFENFPGLTMKDNRIHAAYAVARNIADDNADKPYWVADVIVYEVYNLSDVVNQTSVSLAFYTPTRTSGNVQEIYTLNSKTADPEVTLIPKDKAWNVVGQQWGNGVTWDGYGFYALYNETEAVDGVMEARSIDRITKGNYTKNNIHAGIIVREAYVANGGQYIDVDMGDGKIASIEITNKIYSITFAEAQSNQPYKYNVATLLHYANDANKQVRNNDMVIWVGEAKTNGAKSTTSFVVDLGSTQSYGRVYAGSAILEDTPDWLVNWSDVAGNPVVAPITGATYGEWQKIMDEQANPVATYDYKVTVNCVDAAGNVLETLSYDVNKNGSVFIPTTAITLDGWTLGAVKNETTNTTLLEASGTVDGSVVSGYWVTGVDKDMVVTAAQSKTAQTLSLTSATGTITLKLNDGTANSYTSATNANVVIDDEFEFVITGLDNVTNQYTLTSTPAAFADDVEVTWNGDNDTATIKGTVPAGDVTLTLTAATRATTTINVASGSEAVTFTVNNPNTGVALVSGGVVYQGTDVTFTVDALGANESVDKVTYTVGAGTPVEITADDNDVYTVPGDVVKVMPITINVTKKSTADRTVNFTNNATCDVFMTKAADPNAGDWEDVANTTVAYDYDGTIKIQAMEPVTVSVTNATVSAPTNFKDYTISNITGNVTITIDDAGTATGLGATIASSGAVTFTGTTTGNNLLVYVTTGTSTPTLTVGVGMTVAEAQAAISNDTSEAAGLTPVADPTAFSLTDDANTHYLVIVETNASDYVTKAGTVQVTGIT